MFCKCLRCDNEWESRVEFPKRCPVCVSPLWNVERKRAKGGGSKGGGVLGVEKLPVQSRVVGKSVGSGEDLMPWDRPSDAATVIRKEDVGAATETAVHPDYVADVLFGGVAERINQDLLEAAKAAGRAEPEVYDTGLKAQKTSLELMRERLAQSKSYGKGKVGGVKDGEFPVDVGDVMPNYDVGQMPRGGRKK